MHISSIIRTKTGWRHAAVLDLDIKIEDGVFAYNLFEKQYKFPSFIVCIPHFERNIPSTIFDGSIHLELPRIAICTLKLVNFVLRAAGLYSMMLPQGANQSYINKQVLKGFQRYLDIFKAYSKNYNEFLEELKNYLSSK